MSLAAAVQYLSAGWGPLLKDENAVIFHWHTGTAPQSSVKRIALHCIFMSTPAFQYQLKQVTIGGVFVKCDSGYNEFQTIERRIRTGDLFSLSREELEEYLTIVSQGKAHAHYGMSECDEIRNVVRMALVIKIGDDANRQAGEHSEAALELSRSAVRTSKNAFYATIVAILIAAVSAGFSIWNILNTTPMQVYSAPKNPVVIQEISPDGQQ